MATNILQVTAAHSGTKFPLRGDMSVNLDFTPDEHFRVSFVTRDTGTFTINSALHPFRALNATTQTALSIGGKIGLSFTLMYDKDKNEWAIVDNNLVAGDSGTGTGGTGGTAATIAVDSTVTGAPGTSALVENVGTSSAVRLKFTIPRGDTGATGASGTGGTGSSVPAGGTTGQYLGKTGNADGQVGWLTIPNTGTGTGTGTGIGSTPEVLLTQNANGEITPDKALGNRFRVMVNKAAKILNPVGYTAGEDIAIAFRFDSNGPYQVDWGNAYAFKDRQPPKLPTQAGALVEIFARLTDDIDANNKGGWMTRITPDGANPTASVLGYGVASFVAKNVQTGAQYYVLRSPTQLGAMTDMKPGQTLKILRNALGIEAYGALDDVNGAGNYLISGALPNGNRAELRTGAGVRSAYDKGVLAFAGSVGLNVIAQDLILSGAREQSGFSHIAQGLSATGNANITLKNVRLYDNENGCLTSNDYTGRLEFIDCEFDGNAVGDYGYTHNIYVGHHLQAWYATRCTFKNAVGGHNIKTRSGDTVLKQVHCYNSIAAREFEMPNGGKVDAQDCIFEHLDSAIQNDCIRIGVEGVDTARPRAYTFRNCHFVNGKNPGNAASFIWNEDPDVDVFLIDCTFAAPNNPSFQWATTNAQGNIGRVIVQFTPGVTPGPRVPVGYQPKAVTPIAG